MDGGAVSGLRHIVIDTDTGSDDVWAIIEALRYTDSVCVEAITTVCGNLPLELCLTNALHAEDAARTSYPGVYRGSDQPLCNERDFYAPYVHGSDGLSDMHLPPPSHSAQKESAVDALLRLSRKLEGRLELVTCGPLTNLAKALQRDPTFAQRIRHAWILGGSGGELGNMTKAAEYNVYVDPEAAELVLNSGMNCTWVTWDAFQNGGEITFAEAERLGRSNDPAARFCERCSRQLRAYYFGKYGRESFGVVDTVVMTAALYPEIIAERFRARCAITLDDTDERGHFSIDRDGIPNAEVVTRVDTALYKQKLFALLGMD